MPQLLLRSTEAIGSHNRALQLRGYTRMVQLLNAHTRRTNTMVLCREAELIGRATREHLLLTAHHLRPSPPSLVYLSFAQMTRSRFSKAEELAVAEIQGCRCFMCAPCPGVHFFVRCHVAAASSVAHCAELLMTIANGDSVMCLLNTVQRRKADSEFNADHHQQAAMALRRIVCACACAGLGLTQQRGKKFLEIPRQNPLPVYGVQSRTKNAMLLHRVASKCGIGGHDGRTLPKTGNRCTGTTDVRETPSARETVPRAQVAHARFADLPRSLPRSLPRFT